MIKSLKMYIFKDLFILFLEREEGREKETQRNIDVGEIHQSVASSSVASPMPPTGDLAHNPGMCPDWELNQQPCSFQASTQSTEPHQPGLHGIFLSILLISTSVSWNLEYISFRRFIVGSCHFYPSCQYLLFHWSI